MHGKLGLGGVKLKLYDLVESYRNLLDLADNSEIPQYVIIDGLSEIKESIEEKAVNIAKMLKSIETDAEAIKAEEKRLAERRKLLENKHTCLKLYLEEMLKTVGMKQIKSNLFTISIQKNPPSVNVFSTDDIPERFWIPQDDVLDKKGILEALKNGEQVPGAQIMQTESLRVR